jgi:hypothetical protein
MRNVSTWLLALSSAAMAASQPPVAPRNDDELKAHLATTQRRLDDESIDLGVRARLALECAGALDRAAFASPAPEVRRARWSEAAQVLERFTERHPTHPEARAFPVQAAVYLWARARDEMRAARLNLADSADSEAAVADLKSAIERLRPISREPGQPDDLIARNARYRLAQAYADLAEVDASVTENERAAYNREALAALEPPINEPSLQGFALLLKATLLARLNRTAEAVAEIDAAATARPAPPEAELVEARTAVLAAKQDFSAAIRVIDASTLDPNEKAHRRVEVRLAECAAHVGGPEREASEKPLFVDLATLRRSGRSDARASLAAAAARLEVPGPGLEPAAWDLLADGAASLGDPARAGRLEQSASRLAAKDGKKTEAAEFRLKAGAYFFQAEEFEDADPLLTAASVDPDGGASRAHAGLLRALGRGRALALGKPGFTESRYQSALKAQIKNFPNDPSASEARWLLGRLRLAESDRDGAIALWEAIPHGAGRWVESRSAIAGLLQQDLDRQRMNNDREAVESRAAEARKFLQRALGEAKGETEQNDLRLALARLELTPRVGRPDEAAREIDAVLRSAARPDQRDQARRLNVVSLAAHNRWIDAEQAARQEAASTEVAELSPMVRMLDRMAAEAETDLRSRRIGYLNRILLSAAINRPDGIPAALRPEIHLRFARALLFNGDDAGARRAVAAGVSPSTSVPDEFLRDLAETYARLDAYAMAVEVQRLRARNAPTGSIPWFDARYGLALAYYRSGKPTDALQLIEATSILHPELGGGELRDKFIRLRQRIQPTD